jgi:hypothetical protein
MKALRYSPDLEDAASEVTHRLGVVLLLIGAIANNTKRDFGGYDSVIIEEQLEVCRTLLTRSSEERRKERRQERAAAMKGGAR